MVVQVPAPVIVKVLAWIIASAIAPEPAQEPVLVLVSFVAGRRRRAEGFVRLSAKAVVKPIATVVPVPADTTVQAMKITDGIDVN